jgi:hypothetical protein
MLYLAAHAGWGFARAGAEAGEGGYRDTGIPRFVPVAAPPIVRLAAFASFLFGQVLIPGVFAAPFGLFLVVLRALHGDLPALLLVLVASAPTGLAVAGMLLSAGFALLQGGADADGKARRAARWAIGHHAAFLAALLAVAVAGPAGDRLACVAAAAFAAACIGSGVLLRQAARAVAEHEAAA